MRPQWLHPLREGIGRILKWTLFSLFSFALLALVMVSGAYIYFTRSFRPLVQVVVHQKSASPNGSVIGYSFTASGFGFNDPGVTQVMLLRSTDRFDPIHYRNAWSNRLKDNTELVFEIDRWNPYIRIRWIREDLLEICIPKECPAVVWKQSKKWKRTEIRYVSCSAESGGAAGSR